MRTGGAPSPASGTSAAPGRPGQRGRPLRLWPVRPTGTSTGGLATTTRAAPGPASRLSVVASCASRWIPYGWVLMLAGLLLGGALGPGFVLSYDMVWVPDLSLRSDLLGFGSALPRAVPSDAIVAVLDEVVPGMVLQKLVLVGCLVLAGCGAIRLVGSSMVARLVAVSVYLWNPYVGERLWIGHWPVLVGYAALPWLIVAARRARCDDAFPLVILVLLPLGSLSASAGLISAVAALAFGLTRERPRRNLMLIALLVAANAPWLVAGLLHAGSASLAGGAEVSVFALAGEGLLPTPLTAIGLGGIWNSDVVPAARLGSLAVLALAVTLTAAAFALRSWWRAGGRRDGLGHIVCWVTGFGVAVLTWAAPAAVGWFGTHVPGGGLVRDGARMLALCAPLTAILSARAAERLCSMLGRGGPRAGALVGCVLFPLMVLPGLAWGIGGALDATHYPRSFESARRILEAARPTPGDVLILPFSSYRAPEWNGRRRLLDPLGRYLSQSYLASDDLVVSGRLIRGEDARGPRVGRALAQPGRRTRVQSLARIGVGFVALDKTAPGGADLRREAASLGTSIYADDTIMIVRLDATPEPEHRPTSWLVALVVAWAAYLTAPSLLLLRLLGHSRSVRRRLGESL